MQFLVDECTGPNAADWLLLQGHEVFSAHKQSRGASDEFLLRKAFAEHWILITNDKDFGEKVYRERLPHRGVIFLRLEDERATNKIRVLEKLLAQYADQIADKFVVATEKRVRFASFVPLLPETENDSADE